MRLWQEVIPSKVKEDMMYWQDELNRCYNFLVTNDEDSTKFVDTDGDDIYASENMDNLLIKDLI